MAAETRMQVGFHLLQGERSCDFAELSRTVAFLQFLETKGGQQRLALAPVAYIGCDLS